MITEVLGGFFNGSGRWIISWFGGEFSEGLVASIALFLSVFLEELLVLIRSLITWLVGGWSLVLGKLPQF